MSFPTRLFIPLFSLFLTLSPCSLFGPVAPAKPLIASPAVSAIMTPNDPKLSYPIYASFEEIEALFQQQDNRIYVINFWATWCRPCITEMPFFEQLARESDPENLQVIMVSLDKVADIRTRLKDFVNDRPMVLPTLAFTDNYYEGWIKRVDRSWTGSIPLTLFYRNGQRYFNRGQISNYSELEGLVSRVR
jgi:thiol-disulfide isomerase/thioredoxin